MAIKPGKYDPLKPDIELFDYKSKKRYGLRLEGQGALQVGTVSQDDSVQIRNVGKRVGDFDEQRSWKGGRGNELLSDNAEAFWDSMNMWTLSDKHMHQTLLWRFARGLRSCDFFMPDTTHPMDWMQLLGASKYVDMSWSSAGFTADYARLWIRRVGTPGTLTFRLHSDSAGNPGTVLQTVTKDVTDITDYVSVLQLFNWTGTQALTASTTYHITVFGSANDNKNNHWEVGGYRGGATGKISPNDSSWSAASFDMYYYVADADLKRQWFSFFLDGAMYMVDKKDNLATA
ncbi:MAG TPA: choice-of-anchor R domain-containing protein, partial [Candidatus Paceibacterota bacterium]